MRVPRYVKQIRESDCGPVAILNTLKWAGARVTLKKHHKPLSDLCRVQDGFGTSIQHISLALSHVKKGLFSFRYSDKPTLKAIDDHLKKGGAVILSHPNEIGLHVSLLIKHSKIGYSAVNAVSTSPVANLPRRLLRSWTRKFSVAWFITRIGTAVK